MTRPRPSSAAAPDVRRLAINFLLLTAGECVAKLLTFAGFVYLGRLLGPEVYGRVEFVLATMVFFTLPVDFGLGTYGAREVARDRGRAADLLREVSLLRLLFAAVSFGGLLLLVAIVPESPDVKLLLVLYGLSLFAVPSLLQWFFQGHDGMHWVALASVTRQSVFACLLFLFFRADTPLPYIGVFECASVLAAAGLCQLVLRRKLRPAGGRRPVTPATLLGHLRKAGPIGLGELAWAFYWYFVTVLMGVLVGGEELGWFGVSHRIVMALHTFVWLYFFNLLPSLSRCAIEPGEHLRGLLSRSLGPTTWAGLFIGLTPALFAGPLLSLVYGPDYAGAALPLTVLVWMIPIALVSGHYRFTLIAANRQQLELCCTVAAAVTSVGLGLLLIPNWGAAGGAAALVTANVLNFALAYFFVQRFVTPIPCHRHLARPLLSLAAALLLYLALQGLGQWLAAGVAAFAYLSLFAVWALRRLASLPPR